VIPLSTKDDILTNDFRVKISTRDGLKEDSLWQLQIVYVFLHKYLSKKLDHLLD